MKKSQIKAKKVCIPALLLVASLLLSSVGGLSLPTYAASFYDAKPIAVNTPVTGSLPTSSTENYYKIDLANPGKVSIDFNHAYIDEDIKTWYISLTDGDENEFLSMRSTGRKTAETSVNTYLGKGIYYMRVYMYSHSGIDYTFKVNYEKNNGQFEIEPKITP